MAKRRILTARRIFLALLAIFLILQIWRIDKTNPPADPAADFIALTNPPQSVATTLKNACYDCHSNQTVYPWYTNIAPFSWWIKGHIDNGREGLNFSTWADYTPDQAAHKMEEIGEEVEATKMPILSYIIAHPEARLSDEQRKELVEWSRRQ